VEKSVLFALILVIVVIFTSGCTENIEDLNKKAKDLEYSGRYDDALEVYQKILKIDENNLAALNGRANCQSWLGDYEESNIALMRIEQIDPDDGFALLKMAENYEKLGRYGTAVQVYDRAGTAFMKTYEKGGMDKEMYEELSAESSERLMNAYEKM